ncbi:polysaccharide deacetylase family protein [Rossellomorea aquimaris]|uniref:polysaccharide deacetylase family protein n=1 Tax=Rossellomorea aquimaris TaxID=189382 RepID=UPI001CD7BB41|nr:polysaccharide deacetylase family protein [Rossellomorea aquimaris]MCA1060478.1 polysaccharide deacetylase family protein [Rossellomorea aquimaris]
MLKKIPFRRIRWPGWVVLAVIGLSFVYGMTQLIEAIRFEPVSDSVSPLTNDYKTETKNTDTYTMSINIPMMEDESIKKPIQRWIEHEKEAFLEKVKENKNQLGNGTRAHLVIQADSKKSTDDTFHILFHSYMLVGDVKGKEHVKTFTINAAEKKIVKLPDIMKTNEESINMIGNRLMGHPESKVQKVLQDPASWNWSLNEKALTLYFNDLDEYGPTQVNIPIHAILPYLDERIEGSLKVAKASVEYGEKYVALTFDDGPDPDVTPRILKILKDHDVHATFFMLGSQAEKYPDVAKDVAEAGHEIGNHSDHHKDLTKIGKEQMVQEVLASSKKIMSATGQLPSVLRPPYGAINAEVERFAQDSHSTLVLWSVDSLDWKNKNVNAIHSTVQKEIAPGAIILLHDVHSTTADALPGLLAMLEKEGYQFITVSQLQSKLTVETASPFYGNMKKG